ncbi:MAG: nodulation protein NfeD [Dehalococcoidia bacterium]
MKTAGCFTLASIQSIYRMRAFVALALLIFGMTGLVLGQQPASAQAVQPQVAVVDLDGAIGNVTARYIERALQDAEADGTQLVVIRIDTPGGLLSSTREMVGHIFASEVPVAVFVSPEGAQAASAGTFIGAAASILAMAPATNIGAASVVGGQGEELPETLGRKATEDAAALIRSIANQRGRNVEALEATVWDATAYSANEAVELNIADLIATNIDDLITQVNGMTVPTAAGDVTLELTGAQITQTEMSLFERVLLILADPNIAFLLISLGGIGLIVELWNPGMWIPGSLGAAFLVLGFAGVGNLPFSWAGVALIILAFLLFYLEAQAPGIGYFGIAGAVALILGGIFLVGFFGPPVLPPGSTLQVNRWLLAGVGITAGLSVLWLARQIQVARKLPPYLSPLSTGQLVGEPGEVTVKLRPKGEVRVAGEEWSAELVSGGVLDVGGHVKVSAVDGLRLLVESLDDESEQPADSGDSA